MLFLVNFFNKLRFNLEQLEFILKFFRKLLAKEREGEKKKYKATLIKQASVCHFGMGKSSKVGAQARRRRWRVGR